MAFNKLPVNNRLIDNVPGAPPCEDTPNNEPIHPKQPDLTCTPDSTKTKAHKQVAGKCGGGQHLAKQLDCTTSIASTQNNGINGSHFGPDMTFSRLSCLANKHKPG
jgi:hypothetical protein